MGGWQQYSVVDASAPGMLRKVDASQVPLSAYLGAVGMPGVTAWYGLTQIIAPKAGDTVVVSAASGAVGSAVGQLAKARGLPRVGIAGGAEKCAYTVDELGFDACIDYKLHRDLPSFGRALKAAAPRGVDGLFENVGGIGLDAVMLQMNDFGRIAMCGMISGYNGEPIPMAAPQLILRSRLKVQGFIVGEHRRVLARGAEELARRVAGGQLKYRETIAQGLANAPGGLPGTAQGPQLRQATGSSSCSARPACSGTGSASSNWGSTICTTHWRCAAVSSSLSRAPTRIPTGSTGMPGTCSGVTPAAIFKPTFAWSTLA
jgi:NADPH-dependent curcumin reductase CurA